MILIIDGSNAVYRIYNAIVPLLSSKGVLITIPFGMLRLLRANIDEFKPDNVIIVWDGGKSKWRKEIYPEYKENRDKKREENPDKYTDINEQINKTKVLINYLGIPQILLGGVEADDIIYSLCNKSKEDIIILSNDKDFWKLVQKNPEISVYNPLTKKLINADNFKEITEFIYPGEYIEYKCLVGDPSDNISGYEGVGDKTARQFLEEFGSIIKFLESALTSKKKTYERIYTDIDTFMRNFKLITLSEHPEIEGVLELDNLKVSKIDIDKLTEKLKEYEFTSILTDLNIFLYPFTKTLLRNQKERGKIK